MNIQNLKAAEAIFLTQYPGGFENPELVDIGKKHRMPQMEKFAKEAFSKRSFADPAAVAKDMIRLVSRSSMVSVFEKPKFKSAMLSLNSKEQERWTDFLYELLHGKHKAGFEGLVQELQYKKLAKWTLITVFGAYYQPQKEVFVKPTTAKLIIEKLELNLHYRPTPTWDFYRDFRKAILAMRKEVCPSLSPNNPAFSGFLMMSLKRLSQ